MPSKPVIKKKKAAKTARTPTKQTKVSTKKTETQDTPGRCHSAIGSSLPVKHQENIRKHIILMSELVEQAVDTAVLGLVEHSTEISRDVIAQDMEINQLELIIDKMCLDILDADCAKGKNLRYIAAIMKINNDLERMGNLAVNIAEINLHLASKRGMIEINVALGQMLEKVSRMVRKSIESLFACDIKLARSVASDDDAVDDVCDNIIHQIISEIQKDSSNADTGTFLTLAVVSLERIADKAAHIAEEVMYMETGRLPSVTHSHDSPHR